MSYVRKGDRLGWVVSPISIPTSYFAPSMIFGVLGAAGTYAQSNVAQTEAMRATLERKLRDWNFVSPYVAVVPPASTTGGQLAVQVTAPWDYADDREIYQNIRMNALNVGFGFSDSNIETAHNGPGYPAGQGQTSASGFINYAATDIPNQVSNLFSQVGDDLAENLFGWPLIIAAVVVGVVIFIRR